MLRDDSYYRFMKSKYNVPESFNVIEVINLNDYNDRDMSLTFIVALHENHTNPSEVSNVICIETNGDGDIVFMKNVPEEVLFDYSKDKTINSIFTCSDSANWKSKYIPYARQVIFVGTES